MERFFKENNIHIEMGKDDLKILEEGPVDFITISYYMTYIMSKHWRATVHRLMKSWSPVIHCRSLF